MSKLLLRQGLLYDGTAWTAAHEVLTTAARRARLVAEIIEMRASPTFAPVVGRLGCLRGVSTMTAFGFTTEIADWHRSTGASRCLSRTGARRVLRLRAAQLQPGRDHQDRQHPMPDGCWSRPHGTTANGIDPAGNCCVARTASSRGPGRAELGNRGFIAVGSASMPVARGPSSARSPSLAGWSWSWSWQPGHHAIAGPVSRRRETGMCRQREERLVIQL